MAMQLVTDFLADDEPEPAKATGKDSGFGPN